MKLVNLNTNNMQYKCRQCFPLDVRCPQLAQAYVPFQIYRDAFCPEQALKNGTLFPELYKPYVYEHSKNHGGKCR